MQDLNKKFKDVFPEKSLVVMLHAHADDESFLSAGIINEFTRHGYKLCLVYLAAGLVSAREEPRLRQKEIRDACRILGVDNVLFLEYCEPQYSDGLPLYLQPPQEIARRVITLFDEKKIVRPILFSYDKNGGYGNRDHITVHQVGREILNLLEPTGSRLFEMTIPRKRYTEWIARKSISMPPNYLPELQYWKKDFGLDEEVISYIYTLSEDQLLLKKGAMEQHKSQIKIDKFPLNLSEDDFKWLFGKEYLKLV